MTDYSILSYFDINCLVAETLGYQPLDPILGFKGLQEKGDITAAIVRGKGRIGAFSPCDTAGDAWPIIEKYRIGLSPSHEVWHAYAPDEDFVCTGENPLRAAMVVFLMMTEGKCLNQ